MDRNTHKLKHRAGFTLVELSIVLIIIGFIIAGISAGTSLVKSAELNSVIVDFRGYQTAYNNFVGRYGAAPGDMNSPSTIFGTGVFNSSCQGNNDGTIGTNANALEVQFATLQLAASGMIGAPVSNYTTACTTSTTAAISATTLGAAKVLGGFYALVNGSEAIMFQVASGIASTQTRTGLWAFGSGATGTNAILLGAIRSATTPPTNPVYSPLNASAIDQKVDDGSPLTGVIRGGDGNGVTANRCYSSNTYNLTTDPNGVHCFLAAQLN